ncbi:LysR family transcriptional regulator [Anaeromyxobacter oryzae]|uniref:Transcriptional regulator n=1 Tax=Anaeromyxobacter oryzae TaxID=2918170 RepID=A0ABM7WPP3_9BACT|nr:LysR family transcriptional regulator [Anaeromyxobacter oryzae]BDG01439.1 transcriptional regulator [Anaeromyxobacter oryzae]
MRTTADDPRTAPLDWEDVRHFVALARGGTLSAAARALRVHHATIARRVAGLEAALGRALFDRAAGRYGLTAAGQAVLERAVEMERAAATLAERAAGAGSSGLVRLTSTRALLDGFLLPRLAPLVARHPELELELLGESRPLSLARHEVDLALRMGAPRRGELVGRRVATMAYAFYAAPVVVAAMETGTPPRRIGFDEASGWFPEAAWLAERWPEDRPAYRASSFLSQQLAARAGLGLALLPRFMGDPDPALVRVLQEPLPAARPIWLLRRASSGRDPHVRAVADFVIGLFERDRALLAGR